MLFKSMNVLKGTANFGSLQLIGVRLFSQRFMSGNLGDNFNFPKHKEFFND